MTRAAFPKFDTGSYEGVDIEPFKLSGGITRALLLGAIAGLFTFITITMVIDLGATINALVMP